MAFYRDLTKHRAFLEAFVETRDLTEAAKIAGIDSPRTFEIYCQQYKNYYRALFEKIGMPEDSVLEMLAEIATQSEKDSDRLKAIELILKVLKTIDGDTINVNVSVGKEEEQKKEKVLYNKIKDNPDLQKTLLEVFENNESKN